MRDDGSHRTALPKRFIVSLVKVFQTTSVELFNEKIVQIHNSMEFQRVGDDNNDTYNDEVTLKKLFKFAMAVHNELFNDGIWQKSLVDNVRSGFAVIYWNDRLLEL